MVGQNAFKCGRGEWENVPYTFCNMSSSVWKVCAEFIL